jgi:hypothetical protein
MRKIKITFIITFVSISFSCKEYLDVVPDSVATIDNAFTQRTSAERYLFTCYSYMPQHGLLNGNDCGNLAFNAADELWYPVPAIDMEDDILNIQRGYQNSSDPYGNYWSGKRGGKKLFEGVRNCNIFLENIHKVNDLQPWERAQWIGEVKFLKAYYIFYLMRMYGPIPLLKENLPISASPEEVQLYRDPVDDVVNYIVELLNEAIEGDVLPLRVVGTEAVDLGRITKSIVLALKAKVLVTAASPLFNGNPEYSNFKDGRGIQLINADYDQSKWQRAADACKSAIDFAHEQGYILHKYFPTPGSTYVLNDTILKEWHVRAAFCEKENNSEVIWANTSSRVSEMQRWAMAMITPATSGSGPKSILGPTNKMVELFYTDKGVPITEAKQAEWNYDDRLSLRVATDDDRFYIKKGEKTVGLHFNRDPRFYAYIGFDRGIWYGNWSGNYDTKKTIFHVATRRGEAAARQGISNYCITGNYAKKLVQLQTAGALSDGNVTGANMNVYPWPEIRLTDLYLLYAEALNELNGYSTETTHWINQVRERVSLPSIEESWTNHSTDPTKYLSKDGLREIIHQERGIELMFEGHRYWDLKRWKKAHIDLNQPIRAWDITQQTPEAFYTEILLANQRFYMRDYLFPIEIPELQINRNLVQNPGW